MAASLALETVVRGARKTEKIIMIIGRKLRECGICDAVGGKEFGARRGGEIEPLEGLREEEVLKGNRKGDGTSSIVWSSEREAR